MRVACNDDRAAELDPVTRPSVAEIIGSCCPSVSICFG